MELLELSENVEIVQTLGDYPNQENDLTPEQLKEKFDTGSRIIKRYLNDQVVPAFAAQKENVDKLVRGMEDGTFVGPQGPQGPQGPAGDGLGVETPEGGSIFNDYDTNEASAQYATAFGSENKALGECSFARGMKKDRSGAPELDSPDFKESDWRYNEAIGQASEANGMGAVAYARASKSFGYRTQTGYPPNAEYVQARPEVVVMTDENGETVYPGDNVGQGAVALGADTAALENHAFAGGYRSIAREGSAFAFGHQVEANGYVSTAFGYGTKANKNASMAVGKETTADGKFSFAAGQKTKAIGESSFASGYRSEATADYAIAMGACGYISNGKFTLYSDGNAIKASGIASFAGGIGLTEASGMHSFAYGNAVKAPGLGAVALGIATEASGEYSFACGERGKATADNATAFGLRSIASAENQTVVGKLNAESADALFIVGNGENTSKRSNAFVVNKDGSIVISSGCYGDKLPDNPVEGQLFFLKV